jgi:hypothetical protein
MIKRIVPNTEPNDQPKVVKTLDGVTTSDDDDTFYQGTGQSVTPATPDPTPVVTTPVVETTMTSAPSSIARQDTTIAPIVTTPSTQYASTVTAANITSNVDAVPNSDADIVSRKMSLEEAKFKLEKEKTQHAMYMEIRKEDFRQSELKVEQEINSKKEHEHWMKAYWRPAMGWLYMIICAFDFIVGPVLAMAMPIFLKGLGAASVSYTQWESLTLSNGGLIHLAFGAILGITAWTRGQEKISKMG